MFKAKRRKNIYVADMAIRILGILGKRGLWIQHFLDPHIPVLYSCQIKERVSLQGYVMWLGYGMGLLHWHFTARIFSVMQFHYEFWQPQSRFFHYWSVLCWVWVFCVCVFCLVFFCFFVFFSLDIKCQYSGLVPVLSLFFAVEMTTPWTSRSRSSFPFFLVCPEVMV